MQIVKEYREFVVQASPWHGTAEHRSDTCTLKPDRKETALERQNPNLKIVTLDTLTTLFNAAKKDFPTLEKKDVRVHSDSISFTPPGKVPASYKVLPPTGAVPG